jgi:predicted dithiol-disulfide oxidoreductase (DUF899 family)
VAGGPAPAAGAGEGADPQPRRAQRQQAQAADGYSCFLPEGEEIFHTYSVYGRGTEYAGNAYTFLDLTALGRQEDWEEPKGRVAPVRGGDPTFTS